MLAATWNVNSIRARLPVVLNWINNSKIDVLLFQEIKCVESDFPKSCFYDYGYNQAIFGQKTYNGVAILSKFPIDEVIKGLGEDDDQEARYIEVVTGKKRFVSVYVPNGASVGSEKYAYKMDFLEKLNIRLQELLTYDEEIIIGGDFNIAPMDIDVHDPKAWDECLLCSTDERLAYFKLLNLGYYDAYRMMHPKKQEYTWWDYRGGAFEKNYGLRIDHILTSAKASDKTKEVFIDLSTRKEEKTSDHCPVFINLD